MVRPAISLVHLRCTDSSLRMSPTYPIFQMGLAKLGGRIWEKFGTAVGRGGIKLDEIQDALQYRECKEKTLVEDIFIATCCDRRSPSGKYP